MVPARRDIVFLCLISTLPYLFVLTDGCLTDDFVHIPQLADRANASGVFGSVDGFGFYRPVQTATYVLNGLIDRFECAASFRATNLLLHVAVVLSAYALLVTTLASTSAALIGATMFALAPKAVPIAVMWISARSEILVALCAIATALLWIRWLRGGSHALLIAVTACFTAALLSKESAALLPIALVLAPGGRRSMTSRMVAGGVLLLVVPAILLLRASIGVPLATVDMNAYAVEVSPIRWARNYLNYLGRALPPALAVLAMVWLVVVRRLADVRRSTMAELVPVVGFGLAWFTVLIAPVLPLVLRSEVRIYLPALGLCLAAGAIAAWLLKPGERAPTVALVIVAVALGGYQAGRSYRMRQQARFSDALVKALQEVVPPAEPRAISLVPINGEVEQLLRDSIDPYAGMLYQKLVGPAVPVAIVPTGTPPGTQHLVVHYDNGVVRLQ